jgi:hypothetical protein
MTVRKLDKNEWLPFFEGISKVLEGKRAEIEVASLSLGDQIQAEWLPFFGIVYDPKDDLVELTLEDLDHLIHHPREIYVDDNVGGLIAIEIVTADDVREIIKLKDPLMLPAPVQG